MNSSMQMVNANDSSLDPGTALLIETLEKRWQTYRGELKRCRKEPGEAAIHDLRVATRRMLALVDMLRSIAPHPRLDKLRRAFKGQLDSLDDLRDTQVMLVEAARRLGDLPELGPFQGYLIKKEKRLLKSTAKAIKAIKITSVRKRLDSTRKALPKLKNGETRQRELLQVVDRAYGRTLRRYRDIEPAQPATIHRVRVAFKRFRYMVELVFPLTPGFPEKSFKSMQAYQGLMGDIQDVEIFLSVFNQFAAKDSSYNPEPVRQYYRRRHTFVINAYLEDRHQINSFWRIGAKHPFPWEENSEKTASPLQSAEAPPDHKEDENREQVEAGQEAQI